MIKVMLHIYQHIFEEQLALKEAWNCDDLEQQMNREEQWKRI
jgi:hypothetical protein